MADVIGTKVLLKTEGLKGIIEEVIHFAIPCRQHEGEYCGAETYRVKVRVNPCYTIWLTAEEYESELVEVVEADEWWESYDGKTGQFLGYEKPRYK
jgi:hypothetical protein